jgi:hypothetical protein
VGKIAIPATEYFIAVIAGNSITLPLYKLIALDLTHKEFSLSLSSDISILQSSQIGF